MVLKRLRVLGALAILPAVAQVSNTSPKAVLLNAFRLEHGPMRLLVQHDDGSVDSTNWSGYAVTGSNFTTAKGSWIEPAITCNKKTDTELAAFRVGMMGITIAPSSKPEPWPGALMGWCRTSPGTSSIRRRTSSRFPASRSTLETRDRK